MMLRKVTAADPLFVTVTFLAALFLPRFTFPKVKVAGEKLRLETPPTPLSCTTCGLPGALSVMVTAPFLVPPAVGLNTTSMRHAVAGVGDRGLTQLLVWVKSPVATMLLTVTGAPLMLVTIIATGPLAVFSICVPTFKLVSLRLIALLTPVPRRLMVCGLV